MFTTLLIIVLMTISVLYAVIGGAFLSMPILILISSSISHQRQKVLYQKRFSVGTSLVFITMSSLFSFLSFLLGAENALVYKLPFFSYLIGLSFGFLSGISDLLEKKSQDDIV